MMLRHASSYYFDADTSRPEQKDTLIVSRDRTSVEAEEDMKVVAPKAAYGKYPQHGSY